MKKRTTVIKLLLYLLPSIISLSTSSIADDARWWSRAGERKNLSFTLRVELFSFANGNRFLTAPVHSTAPNASVVSDAERTLAVTVTTMLQRLPTTILVNRTMERAASRVLNECTPVGCNISEPLMQTYLQILDDEFTNDDHLGEMYVITKSALALTVTLLRVGNRVPYDPTGNLDKTLFEWSKNKEIRSFLISNMLLNYCALLGSSSLRQTAAFAEALTLLARDSVEMDEKTENLLSIAISKAVEISLNFSSLEDDFQHPNFFWYNHIANETVINTLDAEIRKDSDMAAKFDAIRQTLLETHEYGFRIQSLLLLIGLTILSTLIVVLLWWSGRFIYRKCRSRYTAQMDEDDEPIEVELPDD